jgi:Flp pilus assembly pilin Flp
MTRGQSTVEYLLLASVLSIALVALLELTGTVATDSTKELGSSMATSLATDGVQR